jgi:hypothetical protein
MPCQAVVDENPMAVLIRRDDNGKNLLCNHCRKTIYVNNKNAENGLHNFTFERPNSIQKETAQRMLGISESASICCEDDLSSWDTWYCKLCKSKVWAKPRMFHGENEPEDWWWCNTCKKQKKEQMFLDVAQSGRHKAENMTQIKKADGIKQQSKSYPKLDKWLGR